MGGAVNTVYGTFVYYQRVSYYVSTDSVCGYVVWILYGITLLTHYYRVVTAAPQLGSVQTALTVPVWNMNVRLVLEANEVKDAGQVCDLLSEHGVRNIQQFSAMTKERLREWGINNSFVYHYALPAAQSLTHKLTTSPHTLDQLSTLKQQLLVS